MNDSDELKKKIEAILFAAGRTVTKEEIEELLEIKTPGLVGELISDLKKDYLDRQTSILLIEEGSGWKLTVAEKYLEFVQKINPHTELTRAVMETLAVIAWKQPITQAQVVEIRSNKAYDHIKELVELGFISKDKFGRSFILKPTQKFLDYFDLPNQESAKKVFKEFKDEDIQKKVVSFKKDKLDDSETLGALEVYDSGEEEEVYKDRSSLKAKKHNQLGNLEIYDESRAESVKQPSESTNPTSSNDSSNENSKEEPLDPPQETGPSESNIGSSNNLKNDEPSSELESYIDEIKKEVDFDKLKEKSSEESSNKQLNSDSNSKETEEDTPTDIAAKQASPKD